MRGEHETVSSDTKTFVQASESPLLIVDILTISFLELSIRELIGTLKGWPSNKAVRKAISVNLTDRGTPEKLFEI